MNITSVSTTGVADTFSGTIYETNGIGPATKQVTAGEFKITFKIVKKTFYSAGFSQS